MLSAPFDFYKPEIPGATGSGEAAWELLTVSEMNHPHPSTGAQLGKGGLQGREALLTAVGVCVTRASLSLLHMLTPH